MKRLLLAVGLITVIALVAGLLSLNTPPSQTTSTPNQLSFTYSVNNNTYTFAAVDGYANYAWNFGDSSTGAGSVVSHTYLTNGNYEVTLTADPLTGSAGPSSAFQQVLVNSITMFVHHYFENLNLTMGNAAS